MEGLTIATLNVCTTAPPSVSLSVSAITFVTRSKTNMAIRQRLGGGGGIVGRVGGGHAW